MRTNSKKLGLTVFNQRSIKDHLSSITPQTNDQRNERGDNTMISLTDLVIDGNNIENILINTNSPFRQLKWPFLVAIRKAMAVRGSYSARGLIFNG